MLFKKALLVLIVGCAIHVAYACGNEYYTQTEIPVKDGRLDLDRIFDSDYEAGYWSPGFGDNIHARRRLLAKEIAVLIWSKSNRGGLSWQKMEKALEKGVDHRLLSDYAWYELRVGDKQNAVKLLEKLYEKYPSEYNIVANLGTAYEVIGNNEKALELLKKAVAINPKSHHGSEWIHIKILEQKLKSSPDYKQIIDLSAGGDYPRWLKGKRYDKPMPPDSLMVQLAYQLHERISFIPAPDPIVGQLILDFGDIVAMRHSTEQASYFYDRALAYDSSLAQTVKIRTAVYDTAIAATEKVEEQSRGETLEQITVSNKKKTASFTWIYIAAAALLVGVSVFLSLRRRNQRLK